MTTNPEPVKPPEEKEPGKDTTGKDTTGKDTKGEIYEYLRGNTRDTIAYVLLVLGILLIYFEPIYGGLLVGIVAGIYFGEEIVKFIKDWKFFIDKEGIPRSLIVAGVIFAFFISAPAIFLGAFIALLVKQIFVPAEKN